MAGRRQFSELPNKIQRHYLWNCSERGQKLACLCAVKNDMRIPPSWAEKRMNWHRLVLELHQNPQRSFCEAAGTDEPGKVSEVLPRHPLDANKIWKMVETGITTVLEPKEIVAGRGGGLKGWEPWPMQSGEN
jgi:hypothetical protein